MLREEGSLPGAESLQPASPPTHPSLTLHPPARHRPQSEVVRLGNSHAALLEGAGHSWEAALAEGSAWRLVAVVQPGGAA